MTESSNIERPFAFALNDSETSEHPLAGTIVDQVIALRDMGKTDSADALVARAKREIADIFAQEEAAARQFGNK